jgi:hypothetical protein
MLVVINNTNIDLRMISDIKKIDPNNLDFILRFIEKKEDFFL